MRYFLKLSTPSKKGLYLQIYQSTYIPGKGSRNKSYKAIGYFNDLIAKGSKDPLKEAQEEVDELNNSLKDTNVMKIGETSLSKNMGYFVLKSMWDYLSLDDDYKRVSQNKNFHLFPNL